MQNGHLWAPSGDKRTVKKHSRHLCPSLQPPLARSGGLVSDEKTRAPKPLTLNPWGGGARHTDSLEYLKRGHKTLLESSPLPQVHCIED